MEEKQTSASNQHPGSQSDPEDPEDPDTPHRLRAQDTRSGGDGVDGKDGTGGLSRLHTTASSAYLAPTLSRAHEMAFVAIVCSAQLTTQVGLGQTLSIIHVIGTHYGLTSPGDLAWFLAAYSLTVGSFILVSGRLGDLYGHKRMLVIGYLWFALWTLIAGLAVYSNVVLFYFARALQGIGPSILLPNALAVLGSSYPPGARKHMVFAIFGAMAPAGSVLGSAMAAVFALAWWPWTFFSFAVALVFLAGLTVIVIPEPSARDHLAHDADFWAKIKQIDLPGAAAGVTSLVLINIAWNQAPIVGWHHPYVYVLLILGLLLIPVFFYIELRVSPMPLLPLDALKSADIGFVLGCLSCGWGCFGIWIYYLWQFNLELRGASPLLATAMMSPVVVSGGFAAIATGYLLGRIGPAWTMVTAMSAFLTGICLIATMPPEQTYWSQNFVCTLIITWGMDMSFPASTVILSNAVSKRHQGVAASLVNTIVNYSISLALGFAGTAEVYVVAGGTAKEDVLAGYRAAMYVGVGLAGCGWLLSLVFLLHDYRRGGRAARKAEESS
ncbi:major facilitator superfamily domain-containing protein [Bombardia bombarda]|uniref:Major facilitator superfamily domain-containing protein n=1 Tax=Bombardia bombarda TaxID=252184 RepID=A0AA39X7H3_9PEZI|nr:major facilitator superfamily domain-containing protein [Bombardia bombarda]